MFTHNHPLKSIVVETLLYVCFFSGIVIAAVFTVIVVYKSNCNPHIQSRSIESINHELAIAHASRCKTVDNSLVNPGSTRDTVYRAGNLRSSRSAVCSIPHQPSHWYALFAAAITIWIACIIISTIRRKRSNHVSL